MVDRTISFVVFVLYSIPSFVAALFLIIFVAGGDYLNLLPMYGANSIDRGRRWATSSWLWDRIVHLILPVVCLTYASLASISRYSRVSMLEALGQDFVRTARAKGLPNRLVIFRHALRNALIPIITIFALELPGLISGAVIIEQIFSLHGHGPAHVPVARCQGHAGHHGHHADRGGRHAHELSRRRIILYVVVDPRITYE